jgi:DNA-binding NarL/FixJ family response regulator
LERKPRILVVDDTPRNIKVLEAMLAPRGYAVVTASSGPEALLKVAAEPPDLVLTDVVMPEMDGYELCRRLRADPATRLLPVVMVTASGDREKVSALEAGADDFVQKPFNQAELLARVASLLRIKTYQDTIQDQATELAELNRSLEARVQEQVTQLERLGRLRRFLAPQVAELLVSADGEALLESHRRQIAVVCCQLPGFAAFADATAPEEVLAVLRAYHEGLGSVIYGFEGTVGPLVEDRLTVLFNDPLPIDDPGGQAVQLALAMRARMAALLASWRKAGYTLDFTVGIDLGYATLGTIGFAGKTEYGAIGTVVHLAARLAETAQNSQILISQRVQLATEQLVESSGLGEQVVAGLAKPVPVFLVERLRLVGTSATTSGADRLAASGPLTEREREVVGLIVRGCTNREIAEELVIAEGTAVRHVANILNKLGLHSRAQVAVWAVEQARPVA